MSRLHRLVVFCRLVTGGGDADQTEVGCAAGAVVVRILVDCRSMDMGRIGAVVAAAIGGGRDTSAGSGISRRFPVGTWTCELNVGVLVLLRRWTRLVVARMAIMMLSLLAAADWDSRGVFS